MTTAEMTAAPSAPTVVDRRPSQYLKAMTVVAGGVLFAVGNLLHPLTHDDAAAAAPTWVAAHVVFGIGALLIAGGIGALARRFRGSVTGLIGLAVMWLGMVLIPGGTALEAFVRPLFDHHQFEAIEEATFAFSNVAGTATILGPVLVAIAGLRHRLFPVVVCIAPVAITLGALLTPAMPAEGYSIIPGTVVFGLGVAAAAWLSRNDG
jgi:hypothetical protein